MGVFASFYCSLREVFLSDPQMALFLDPLEIFLFVKKNYFFDVRFVNWTLAHRLTCVAPSYDLWMCFCEGTKIAGEPFWAQFGGKNVVLLQKPVFTPKLGLKCIHRHLCAHTETHPEVIGRCHACQTMRQGPIDQAHIKKMVFLDKQKNLMGVQK